MYMYVQCAKDRAHNQINYQNNTWIYRSMATGDLNSYNGNCVSRIHTCKSHQNCIMYTQCVLYKLGASFVLPVFTSTRVNSVNGIEFVQLYYSTIKSLISYFTLKPRDNTFENINYRPVYYMSVSRQQLSLI